MKKIILISLLLVTSFFVKGQGYKLVGDNGVGVKFYCDTTNLKDIGFGFVGGNFMSLIKDSTASGQTVPVYLQRLYQYRFIHDTTTLRVCVVNDLITGYGYQTSTGTDFYKISADSIAHFVMKQLKILK